MASGDAYIYQTFTFKLDSNALKKQQQQQKQGSSVSFGCLLDL